MWKYCKITTAFTDRSWTWVITDPLLRLLSPSNRTERAKFKLIRQQIKTFGAKIKKNYQSSYTVFYTSNLYLFHVAFTTCLKLDSIGRGTVGSQRHPQSGRRELSNVTLKLEAPQNHISSEQVKCGNEPSDNGLKSKCCCVDILRDLRPK